MIVEVGEVRNFGLTTDIALRLDKLVVVRLDEAEPLFDAALDVSSALTHITK